MTNDTKDTNPTGLQGIDYVELAGPEPKRLERLLLAFGFSRTMQNAARGVDLYEQNDITFFLHTGTGGHAGSFSKAHGPCIPGMGWRVEDASKARDVAVSRGAKAADADLARGKAGLPSIFGIGDSVLSFVDHWKERTHFAELGFAPHPDPILVPKAGFTRVDHLTNNVHRGTMTRWSDFYKDVFGFTEVRYFDIRGAQTGLTSYALRSPDGSFCIPINEGTERAGEKKSQIDEYLEEYKGPGVQHLAFLSDDLLASLAALESTGIQTLDIDGDYYASVFDRVPNVREDHAEIQRRNVLVDGDAEGYLLQIFTKNVIGPIFIEMIQRQNHLAFGEGNFGALFRSIERDQQRRGVFDAKG